MIGEDNRQEWEDDEVLLAEEDSRRYWQLRQANRAQAAAEKLVLFAPRLKTHRAGAKLGPILRRLAARAHADMAGTGFQPSWSPELLRLVEMLP